jgi:uncharacterized membrane protein (DUF106 family)
VSKVVLEQITGMVDLVLSPIAVFQPHVTILIIALIVTFVVTGLSRLITKKSVLQEIKNRIEEIRENLTKAQKEGNTENANKFLNEMMKANNEYMKHSFKTMIVSLVIAGLFLPWLGYKYSGLAVANLPFSIPFIGSNLNWIYWYILVSLTIGWIVNKLTM